MDDKLENSILATIKKMLGLDLEYEAFDVDVITHINTSLMTLQQLGVGPESGMFITGVTETWNDFFSSQQMLEAAKSYIYIRVRMVFDPPTNSFVLDSLQKTSDMLEQRLKEQARFFDAEKGKYVRRTIDTDDAVEVLNVSTGQSVLINAELAGGEVFSMGSIGLPVHIERDGVTPIDLNDLGQNTIMRGDG